MSRLFDPPEPKPPTPYVAKARHRDAGRSAHVLVRADSSDPGYERSVAVWFTEEEWDALARAILASHGLAQLPPGLPTADDRMLL